jgi:hypothetical protein
MSSKEFTLCQDGPLVMRYHEPTHAGFEIIFDEDQARLGGLSVFGFAAQLSYTRDGYQPPNDFEELAATGRDAIIAFLERAAQQPTFRSRSNE